MRIIGGIAGGTLLKVPKGLAVRPTPDLVRQAIFNSLGTRVEQTRVLELFAGTGALSLECLSRGARRALCVEQSLKHARVLRGNLEAARLPAADLEIWVQDAFAALARLAALESPSAFDLVFADPPYGEKNLGRRSHSNAQQLLDDLSLPLILAPKGLLILGHARRDTLSVPAGWLQVNTLRHGDSLIEFLQFSA